MTKKLLIVANWKSNKTIKESLEWLDEFNQKRDLINFENKEVILCPSFTALSSCYEYIKANNMLLSLGVQNVSKFEVGSYTGEVSARQVKEIADYAIIGHSERRENYQESEDDVTSKVEFCQKEGVKTIVCLQAEFTPIPEYADFVAYEPVFAIGTGNPDSPENIEKVFKSLSEKTVKSLLYGGSLNIQNVSNYKNIPLLSGFLVGSASLDPDNFSNLLQKC